MGRISEKGFVLLVIMIMAFPDHNHLFCFFTVFHKNIHASFHHKYHGLNKSSLTLKAPRKKNASENVVC